MKQNNMLAMIDEAIDDYQKGPGGRTRHPPA